MDREEFEQEVIGYVFDEPSGEPRDKLVRYLDAHADAREEERRLRATLELTRIPLEEPSPDLEERILVAAALAEQQEPWHRKLVRALAWAGSHAMRPQLAMGALMVMLLGSSLLLLRAKPGAMRVTSEQGGTSPPREPQPIEAATAAARPTGGAPRAESAASPPRAAVVAPTPLEPTGGAKAEESEPVAESKKASSSGELARALAVKAASGCGAALPLFAELAKKHGSRDIGVDAESERTRCEQELATSRRAAAPNSAGSSAGGRAGASHAAKAAPKPVSLPAAAPKE